MPEFRVTLLAGLPQLVQAGLFDALISSHVDRGLLELMCAEEAYLESFMASGAFPRDLSLRRRDRSAMVCHFGDAFVFRSFAEFV